MGKRPDYRVYTAVEMQDGNTKWIEIGVGFENPSNIVVNLNALPVNRKLIIKRLEDENKTYES